MGGSILIQVFVANRVDTKPRKFVVIDHTGTLYPEIEKAVAMRNASLTAPDGKVVGPRFELEKRTAPAPGSGDKAAGLALSDEIRGGGLDAYIEIPAGILDAPDAANGPRTINYHSDNPNDDTLRRWFSVVVNNEILAHRFRAAGIDRTLAERLGAPVNIENLQLVQRSAEGADGQIKEAQKVDMVRSIAVPSVLMFSLFFVIMTSCPQLMNSVIEEKMSRISEVMLGSVSPFELMMGKLLGNVGVAMVLAGLYLGGAFAVAAYHGYADIISPGLVAVLIFFLFLAVLFYGSLYMAVGSACSELKDAQSLMMPVLLLSMFPAFVWSAVLKNPASPLSVGMSLFPPASPFLMLMRMVLKPSPPPWQVVLAVVLTTATAIVIVWAAGKIFRTGLLMQGKPPSFVELAKWVMTR
jgi:ABC-type Na+ efflux pump permease subunit